MSVDRNQIYQIFIEIQNCCDRRTPFIHLHTINIRNKMPDVRMKITLNQFCQDFIAPFLNFMCNELLLSAFHF
jgi:hypothetical protein